MDRLKNYAEIDRSCTGILWNIRKTGETIRAENEAKTNEEKNEYEHIMISYTWKYQTLAKKIANYFTERNQKVWIDVDEMSGSTLEAMANAIEKSSVVIVLYSEAYKNSANCRRE